MVSETKSTYVECLCSKDCFPLNSPPHGIYKEAILVTTPCCLLKQSDISSAVSGYCSKGISNESSVFMKIIIFVIIVNLMIKLGKGVPKKGGWSYKTWTICFFFSLPRLSWSSILMPEKLTSSPCWLILKNIVEFWD